MVYIHKNPVHVHECRGLCERIKGIYKPAGTLFTYSTGYKFCRTCHIWADMQYLTDLFCPCCKHRFRVKGHYYDDREEEEEDV